MASSLKYVKLRDLKPSKSVSFVAIVKSLSYAFNQDTHKQCKSVHFSSDEATLVLLRENEKTGVRCNIFKNMYFPTRPVDNSQKRPQNDRQGCDGY